MNSPMRAGLLRRRQRRFAFAKRVLSTAAVHLDINNLASVFRDSAGTMLASVGDEVLRVEDQSGNGRDAVQTIPGSGPRLGVQPITGVRNLLTYTEQFDNAAWVKLAASISPNSTTAPDGTLTADTVVESSTNAQHYVRQDYTKSAMAQTFTGTFRVKPNGRNWVYIQAFSPTSGLGSRVWFNVSAGTVGSNSAIGAGWTLVGSAIEPEDYGFYAASITFTTGTETDLQLYCVLATGDTNTSYLGDGSSGMFTWGAQLETGSTATAYQKVVQPYNVTEAGVAGVHFLYPEGAQFMTFPGSKSQAWAKALHDGTGATVVAGVQAGVVDDPDAVYGFLTSRAAIGAGIQASFDDQSSFSRNDRFRAQIINSGGSTITSIDSPNDAVPANTPNVIALTFADPGGTEFYANGALSDTAPLTGTPSSGDSGIDLEIMRFTLGNFHMKGKLFTLAIFDSVLSDAELQAVTSYLAQKQGTAI